MAKLTLFAAAIDAGYTWLAVLAVVNTVISLVYYLRVIAPAYFESPLDLSPVPVLGRWAATATFVSAGALVVAGLWAQPALRGLRRGEAATSMRPIQRTSGVPLLAPSRAIGRLVRLSVPGCGSFGYGRVLVSSVAILIQEIGVIRSNVREVDVQTRFGPDEEEAFFAVRDELIDSYRSATTSRVDADTFTASTMLEYKWGYADGRIFDWTRSDLEDLLLGHFPRKVGLDDEDLLGVVPQIKDFLEFLGREDRLTGDPLQDLHEELDALLPEFVAAMQEPSNFGLAKRLFAQMEAEGVDVMEPGALDRWTQDFNARSFEERHTILEGPEPEPEPHPPIALPSRDELERAARASAALARLTAFAHYAEEGRKLTQRGHLTLSDGKALAELLDTGDQVDQKIGDRTFKTHSTSDLPVLNLAFRWARAAGFVKVRHGTVSITGRGRSLGRKPLEDWRVALEGFPKCDPVVRRYGLAYRMQGPFWNEVLVELLEELPFWLYATGKLDLKLLHDAAWQQIEDRFHLEREPHVLEHWRRMMEIDIDRQILGNLTYLGAVTVTDGTVSLTPLGLWATNRMLRARGELAPVIGEHVRSGPNELLNACAHMPLEVAEQEIRAWVDGRPSTAAKELALAARSGELPMMALHALGFAGPDAEMEVRGLLEVDGLRSHAQLWLVHHGYEDPSSLPPETLQTALIEALAVEIDEHGPVAAVALFQSLGAEDEQMKVVEQLIRAEHVRVPEILEVIGRYYPSKTVAKAARKTAFKRRSSGRP